MRFPRILPATLLTLVLGLFGCSQFKAYNISKLSYDPHGMATMPNGLRVLIVPNKNMAKTLVTVRYQVGGAHAPKGKEGIPHLVEHLAFRVGDRFEEKKKQTAIATLGSAKASATLDEEAKPAEAKETKKKKSRPVIVNYLVEDNAWTSMDYTFYYKKTAPAHLEKVLASFSQQMGDFSSKISKDVLEVEREVVRNERRSRYEGDALGHSFLDIYDKMYTTDHPYHGSNIGSHKTIRSITLDDVSKFLSAHYHPSNAILTITGPVDINQAYSLVQKHFAKKPKKTPSTLKLPKQQLETAQKVIKVKDADETKITVMWPLGKAETSLLRQLNLVDRSAGGWFNYKIKSQKKLAENVSSWLHDGEHGSMYIVTATVKDHSQTQRVKNQIIDIADGLGRWVDKTWMAQAKRRIIYTSLYGLENPIALAEAMSQNIHDYGKPMAWVDYFKELKGVDFKAARESTWNHFDEDKAIIMLHTPRPDLALQEAAPEKDEDEDKKESGGGPSQGNIAKKADKTKTTHDERELPPKIYQFTQPYQEHYEWARTNATFGKDITEYTLDNGIRVLIKQDTAILPVMAISVGAHGGEVSQPKGVEGVSGYAINYMNLKSPVDSDIDYRIASYDYISDGAFRLRFTSKFPSMYAADGIRIVSERLENPRYSWKSISDSIDSRIESFNDKKDSIDTMSWRAFWRARGLDTIMKAETLESYDNISLGKVKDYQESHFYPENMVVSVVGNRSPEEIKPIIEATFGQWSSKDQPALSVRKEAAKVKPFVEGQLISVPMKSSQSKLRLVFNAAGYNDWEAYQLQNGLRQLLSIKLRDLRSTMGVTYGVSVDISEWGHFGNLMITSKVQRDATDKSVKSLLKLIDKFRESKITQGQLERVKRSIFNTKASITRDWRAESRASRLVNLTLSGTPLDVDAKVIEFWNSVTLEQFQAEVDRVLSQTETLIVTGAKIKNEEKREHQLSRFKDKLITYTPDELIK